MTNTDNGKAPEQPPTPGPEIRPMEHNERIIRANGVDLGVQTFGDRADPPILLIMGGASSMDWWEDGFCERLAGGSRSVDPLRPPRHGPIGQLPAGWCALLPA